MLNYFPFRTLARTVQYLCSLDHSKFNPLYSSLNIFFKLLLINRLFKSKGSRLEKKSITIT